jgi:hypothetical protein
MGIKHVFVSTVADGSTTEHVRPSDWNADHTIDGTVILSSGTATNTPLQFVAGALNTGATAGAMEFDGTCFYQTALDATRQVAFSAQVMRQTTTRAISTSTAIQQLFNETTNGAVTVGPGTYFFDAGYTIASGSTTSKTFGWGFGGTATITRQAWTGIGRFGSTINSNMSFHTANSTSLTVAGSTATAIAAKLRGKLVIGASGTLIPSFQIPAGNATVGTLTNAYFSLVCVGSSVVTHVGNWS